MKETLELTWKKFSVYLSIVAILAMAGFLYVEFVDFAPHLVPGCAMKAIFHLYCPGCGGTHALNALFRLHIIRSFLYNPLVLYMAGGFVFYLIKALAGLIKGKGHTVMNVNMYYFWGLLWLMVAFFIIRNILLIFFGVDYLGELYTFWH